MLHEELFDSQGARGRTEVAPPEEKDIVPQTNAVSLVDEASS